MAIAAPCNLDRDRERPHRADRRAARALARADRDRPFRGAIPRLHAAPGIDFRPRYAWRLLILFAIGWLHGLAYSGDILTVYAALGIPLILFYRVPDRLLLVLALLLLVGVPRVVERVVEGPTAPAEIQSLQTRMNAQAEEHWRALTAGDVPAIVRLHATTGFRAKWDFQFGFMGRGFQTFGLFLLGLWAGRHRVPHPKRVFGASGGR